MRIHPLFIATLIPATALAQKSASSDALRPITFLDRQYQQDVGSPTPSPDGKWLLYTLSTPDWNQARPQTDIYLVSVKDGLASTKQMTYTKDKNETSPRWSRDGKLFVFLSNRDASSAPSGGSAAAGGGSAAGTDTLDNRFKAISTGAGTSNWMWMDYWVRGSGKKFAWREVLKTLDPEGSVTTATATSN